MCAFKENLAFAGAGDGCIRVVDPSGFRSDLGKHGDFPIEHLRISSDLSLVASSSHDNTIKFWDTASITLGPVMNVMEGVDDVSLDEHGDSDLSSVSDGEISAPKRKPKSPAASPSPKKRSTVTSEKKFFAGLD